LLPGERGSRPGPAPCPALDGGADGTGPREGGSQKINYTPTGFVCEGRPVRAGRRPGPGNAGRPARSGSGRRVQSWASAGRGTDGGTGEGAGGHGQQGRGHAGQGLRAEGAGVLRGRAGGCSGRSPVRRSSWPRRAGVGSGWLRAGFRVRRTAGRGSGSRGAGVRSGWLRADFRVRSPFRLVPGSRLSGRGRRLVRQAPAPGGGQGCRGRAGQKPHAGSDLSKKTYRTFLSRIEAFSEGPEGLLSRISGSVAWGERSVALQVLGAWKFGRLGFRCRLRLRRRGMFWDAGSESVFRRWSIDKNLLKILTMCWRKNSAAMNESTNGQTWASPGILGCRYDFDTECGVISRQFSGEAVRCPYGLWEAGLCPGSGDGHAWKPVRGPGSRPDGGPWFSSMF
jgi:hypothetical protein